MRNLGSSLDNIFLQKKSQCLGEPQNRQVPGNIEQLLAIFFSNILYYLFISQWNTELFTEGWADSGKISKYVVQIWNNLSAMNNAWATVISPSILPVLSAQSWVTNTPIAVSQPHHPAIPPAKRRSHKFHQKTLDLKRGACTCKRDSRVLYSHHLAMPQVSAIMSRVPVYFDRNTSTSSVGSEPFTSRWGFTERLTALIRDYTPALHRIGHYNPMAELSRTT